MSEKTSKINGPRQTKVEIENDNGEKFEFVLQHPGARSSVQMRDRSKNKHGQLVEENYYGEIMKHVIVEPKVDWSYFDEHPDLQEPLLEKAILFVNNDKSFR